MCDHVIDLVDTEQYYEEKIIKTEIRDDIHDIPENEVFRHPEEGAENQQTVKQLFLLPEEPPDMELPGDQRPFDKDIDIDGNGVAPALAALDKDKANHLREEADQQKRKKGLINPADTAQAYQPCYNGKEDRLTYKEDKN